MNLLPEFTKSQGELESPEMINTFLGPMSSPEEFKKQLLNKENIKELINLAAGGPELKLIGGAANSIGKGINYLRPSKLAEEAEKFRKSTSPVETSTENIENLGKRIQFAKQSGKEEALIPKNEIYSQEGKSDIYKIKEENLPEGNLPKLAEMIEPGVEFSESQSKALKNALKQYRRKGDVESFLEKSEDIFNIPELPGKAASKIEDALLLPTKRESKYFSDKEVDAFYGNKTEIGKLHRAYEEKPILKNYDALQSALKKRERELSRIDKKGTSETVGPKLEQIRENIKNLNEDASSFMQTLPENMQKLEKMFRKKWASGPAKYSDATLTIRKLAEGRASEVTDSEIIKTFTKPNKITKNIIKELGPSVGSNVIYSALNKVKPGNAKGMAETILDLKRTKGFDNFITKDMEKWAHDILTRSKISHMSLKAGEHVAGAIAGGALFGPFGALAGAAIPFAAKFGKSITEHMRK